MDYILNASQYLSSIFISGTPPIWKSLYQYGVDVLEGTNNGTFGSTLTRFNISRIQVLRAVGVTDEIEIEMFRPIYNQDGTVLNFFHEDGFTRETYDIVCKYFKFKLQNGLSFTEIENVIFLFIAIRFLTLLFRYNLWDSLVICGIGVLAGSLWYRHIVDIIYYFGDSLKMVSATKWFPARIALLEQITVFRHRPNAIALFFNSFKDAWTQGLYHTDPISIWVASLDPDTPYTKWIIRFYYLMKNGFIPFWYNFYAHEGRNSLDIIQYQWSVRILKKYVPYLFRWHYTFLMVYFSLWRPMSAVALRAYRYKYDVLLPFVEELEDLEAELNDLALNDPHEFNRLPDEYFVSMDTFIKFREYQWQLYHLDDILITLTFAQLAFTAFSLLHALFGQYFYFPFITENVDLHVGKRPKRSKYSGGYTAWQDRKEGVNMDIITPLWWGWFGRGLDTYFFHDWPIVCRLADLLDYIDLFNVKRNYKRFRKGLRKFYKKFVKNRKNRRKRRRRRRKNRSNND